MDDNIARQHDELEALKAIYPDEFTEINAGEYQISMTGSSSFALRFVLPASYPSNNPPYAGIHCESLHQPLLVTDQRLQEEILRIWEGNGEVFFELISWLTEQEQEVQYRHTNIGGQKPGHGWEHGMGQMQEHEQQRLDLLISADCQNSIVASLQDAGYEKHGICFIHDHEPRCEVELLESDLDAGSKFLVTVTAAGLGGDEIANFVAMELAADRPLEFGAQLLEGVSSMLHMSGAQAVTAESDSSGATGGLDTGADELLARALEKLPSVEEIRAHPRWVDSELSIQRHRQLHIYTWGDALMKKTALKSRSSQFDVNAKPLNGRGGGADTKHNALQDKRIVLNVAASLADARGMQLLVQTLRKIEEEDLHTMSVFCTKGRHRSVSLAVLLQHGFYPNAIVEHLTIR
jgi:hypothetical protein